jgi:hypothetical protein
MADILPSDLYPGYQLLAAAASAPSQGIFIPLADLASLTAAEANASTGDGRAVFYALVQDGYAGVQALAVASRPTKLTITKANPTGVGVDLVRQNYTIGIDLTIDPNGTGLAPEV